MKSILANMGFVMQMTAIFILIPIIYSIYLQDNTSAIALFITSTSFFLFGFLLNMLCERKELGFNGSNALLVITFIVLSLLGSIPYMYVGTFEGSFQDQFVNSFFESASGFTTTGFTLIKDLSVVPDPILLYRTLTQFIGGIGIVLLLLVFIYPDNRLNGFSKLFEIPVNYKIKSYFFTLITVYLFYVVFLAIMAFLWGYKELVHLVSFIFAAISTGGFADFLDITPIVKLNLIGYIIILGMILGASNFIVISDLLKFRIKQFFKSEIILMLILLVSFSLIFNYASGYDYFDSFFHITSAMTTTGFSYINISEFSDNLKLFLAAVMLIGGTSLSTAGGIKMYRIILIIKTIKNTITEAVTGVTRPTIVFGKQYESKEILKSGIVIFLLLFSVLTSSYFLSLQGFNFIDSVFETSSALTCTGLSVGIITPELDNSFKNIFSFLMIIGRVEILSVLIMIFGLFSVKNKNQA